MPENVPELEQKPAFSKDKAGFCGAADRIWTGDLILTNWLETRKLLVFSSFRAFLFRENDVFRPIRSTGSVRFFRRVGQVVGQADLCGKSQIKSPKVVYHKLPKKGKVIFYLVIVSEFASQ